MKVELTRTESIEKTDAAALVVPVFADRQWGPGAEVVADALGTHLVGAMDDADFDGKRGQTMTIRPNGELPVRVVMLAGLGSDPDHEQVRQAAGSAGRLLSRYESVATTLHEIADAETVAMGFLLGQYRFDAYLSEPKPAKTERLSFVGADDEALEAAERGAAIADAVMLARDLVNEPPVYKAPAVLAERARDAVADLPVRVVIHDEAAVAAMALGGLLGVAAGAANPPRLVEMRYEPDDARSFLALVGKGIVFDSGGLSIKPAAGMETMKTDMSGAAAVFGAVEAIARLGLPIKVLAYAPLTENMPGGSAQRPGDVLTARNGKTIEVLNTDAEGRLVLADGLSLAAEEEPDLIVDLATLTGACMVALGDKIAGLFGTDAAVALLNEAAEAAGERLWRLPLPDDYRKKIDSEVADMKNTGPRYGGAITAGLLLKEFAGEGEWAHLDIAGPARAGETEHYLLKGGSGFGVRTIVQLARDLSGSR